MGSPKTTTKQEKLSKTYQSLLKKNFCQKIIWKFPFFFFCIFMLCIFISDKKKLPKNFVDVFFSHKKLFLYFYALGVYHFKEKLLPKRFSRYFWSYKSVFLFLCIDVWSFYDKNLLNCLIICAGVLENVALSKLILKNYKTFFEF